MTASPEAEERFAREERRLMKLVAAGSAEAFGELYDRYGQRAYRVAQSVCRNNGLAEDAVQEAFLSVWRTRESYSPTLGSVAAWLLVVVRNRAVDLSRRNGKHADHRADAGLLDSERAPADVAAEAITLADAPQLLRLLAQLPEAQQEVIALAFYGELSHAEIAVHLDLPAGTVKGRMRLGLSRLRADIDGIAA